MTIRDNKTSIALATSAVLTAGLALSPTLVNADTNSFASTELSSGYMQLAEGNCGANKKAEAKCGANKDGNANHKAKKEGKCGEAKCGANKKKAQADKKAKEGNCGAKKDVEAKCGAKKVDKSFLKNNPSYSSVMGK